jgi:orotate phosphoribosyltransferase
VITATALSAALAERGALMEGHFRLSSGRHSDRFVQKFRILEDPTMVEPVARALAEAFEERKPAAVVSAAVGGIVLGYEVARQLGTKAIFIEKESGVAALRRGFALKPGDRVLVVEDVVTTGGSVKDVIDVVRRSGAEVIGVGAIVMRAPVDFGVPTHALLELPLTSYAPDECPQCKAGQPIADPGSRRA